MKLDGPIFAMDLGTRTGFACGMPGSIPRSGTMLLKQRGDKRSVAFGNLIAWLQAEWTKQRPVIIVKEAALPLQGFKNTGNSEMGARMAYGLHAVVDGMAARFGIYVTDMHPATVRKHFIGSGRMGDRDLTKGAVINRARLLKMIPRDCLDTDRADACALWDYAAAMIGGKAIGASELHLFGEAAE